MADLNQCTSRTLASKAGISSQLADEIVGLRKKKGRIQSFSELWDAEGMTRPIIKQLSANCVIGDALFTEVANMSNNNKRASGKNKKKKTSGKGNIKQKAAVNKQKTGKINSRFLESLPLLADIELADTSHDRSLMTIYTPMAVKSTPSGEKIITVYQVATPDKVRPFKGEDKPRPSEPEKVRPLKCEGKPRPSENRSGNHPQFSKVENPQKRANFSAISRSHRSRFQQKLSATKKQSIEKWLQNTNSQSSRSDLSETNTGRGRRNRGKDRRKILSREVSWSRSRSKSPLLRKKRNDKINQGSASTSAKRGDKLKIKHPVHVASKHSRSQKKLMKQHLGKEKTFNMDHSSGKRVFTDSPVSLLDLEESTEGEKNVLPSKSSRRYVEEAAGRSRSRSVDPVHQVSKETLSVEQQKVEFTKSSRDSDKHGFARRSLWKDTQRRHHRSESEHHHHHHHGRSRDKLKLHDNRNGQNSKESTGSCVIL